MLSREEWLPLARKLDWDYTYVREDEVFPLVISGHPWLPHSEWKEWEESFKTSYREYVDNQYEKDMAVYAVRDAVGRLENIQKLAAPWMNSLKVHAAALPLAEFTGVVGSLRGARFGRDSAWRTMSTFGALDEYRHTQIPLLLFHQLVRWDSQFDWAHKFYHTNNWFAVAARHFFDELTVARNLRPAGRSDLHKTETPLVDRIQFQESLDAPKSLDNSFRVVDAVHSHAHKTYFDALIFQK